MSDVLDESDLYGESSPERVDDNNDICFDNEYGNEFYNVSDPYVYNDKLKRLIIDKLKHAATVFCLPPNEIVKALEILNESYHLPEIKYVRIGLKEVLAGCCVYIAADNRIRLIEMLKFLGCTMKLFNSVYDRMNHKLPRKEEDDCKDLLIMKFLGDVCFDDNKEAIIQRTCELYQMAEQYSLTNARPLEPMVIALAYFAWRSFDTKLKTNFCDFCGRFKFRKAESSNTAIRTTLHWLITLVRHIPWAEPSEINKKNIHCYVKDMLEYSICIRSDFIAKDLNLDPYAIDQGEVNAAIYKTFREPFTRLRGKKKREYVEDNYPEDFSDSELDQYLRTDEEIRLLQINEAMDEAND